MWRTMAMVGLVACASKAETADTGPAATGEGAEVGQIAILTEHHHDTAGTVEILDATTLEVRDFTYDGTGLDVRFYGALDGDWAGGFPISDDLLRDGGYDGETLTLTLPSDRSLDDLNGISLWCIDAAISFGDGMFVDP